MAMDNHTSTLFQLLVHLSTNYGSFYYIFLTLSTTNQYIANDSSHFAEEISQHDPIGYMT